MNIVGIIPARYGSTRFPGKPLAMLGKWPVIRHVYTQAGKSLENVCVATDDERILNAVHDFGGIAVMTSSKHRSGTDRCSEAVLLYEKMTGLTVDVVINIQGDEPFINPSQITLLASCFNNPSVEIATLIRKVEQDENLFDENHPKVVVNIYGDAIYFSRSVIPFVRDVQKDKWQLKHTFYKHIGIYGYRKEILQAITMLSPGSLEIAESLEQNRWLENGFRIRTAITHWESISIDTPEDLEKARKYFEKLNFF